MEETSYLRFCPKHGRQDDSLTCLKCGKETIPSDITWGEFRGYMQVKDKEAPEYVYTYLIEKSFKTDLNKIIAELKSGKKGKVDNALKLLMWRTERDDYIPDAAKWLDESGGYFKNAAAFLCRCTYEKVRPFLDFKNYNCRDEYSIKLFMPFFLEHYKNREPLACEKCKKKTNNLFIKIQSEKKVLSAVRHVGYITQKLEYTGHAIPHAYCDECALKKANKMKKLKDLTDPEKIRGFMSVNSDLNIRRCNDIGLGLVGDLDTGGFSYEYLISPAAAEEMAKNELDRAPLAGMIECALDIKEKLEA